MKRHIVRRGYEFLFCLAVLVMASGCDSGVVDTPEQARPGTPLMAFPSNGATDQPNAVQLQWNAVVGAATYDLQVCSNPKFENSEKEFQGLVHANESVNGLEIGKTYYWRVRAVNEAGVSEWSRPWQFTPSKVATVPNRPGLVFPMDGAVDQPTTQFFSWKPTEKALVYHLQISLEEDFLRRLADVEIPDTTRSIVGLVETYTYYWRVRAKSPAGYSNWSSTWHIVIHD